MLVRVRDFGVSRRDAFPARSVAGRAFTAVATAVAELGEPVASSAAAARGGTGSRTHARAALVDALRVIDRTARAIAMKTPGFDEVFRRPHRRQRDRTLIMTGRLVLQRAAASRDRFVALNLRANFVEDLQERVDRFEQALAARDRAASRLAVARARVAHAFRSAYNAVRTLDVIVANQFRGDSAVQAAWARARRLGHPRRVRTRGKSVARS
jgi:hypothetical protein